MAELNVERFLERLDRIHSHFVKHRTTPAWSNASVLSLCRGPMDESKVYAKSVILHQYLFGYELPELVMILTAQSGELHVLGTKKKMDFLQPAATARPTKIHLHVRAKQQQQQQQSNGNGNGNSNGNASSSDAALFESLCRIIKKECAATNGAGGGNHDNDDDDDDNDLDTSKMVVGTLLKETNESTTSSATASSTSSSPSPLVQTWEQEYLSHYQLVDCAPGIAFALAIKDDTEMDLLKKSSVLSNKLMKHGLIPKMEDIINESTSISHESLATMVEEIIEDPSKIDLKIPPDDVQSCYFPIIQSGGRYDVKVSATSDDKPLEFNVILVSLGARYKNYCSHMSRTFLVDPPKAISDHYELLLGLQHACQKGMRVGKPLKTVHRAAVAFLEQENRSDLVSHLPKSFGFGMGLEFRDVTMSLTAKNPATFKPNMVFTLSCSFSNLPLTKAHKNASPKDSPIQKIDTYSLQIADMISITTSGADIMTKLNKNLTDISYTIQDGDDDDDEDDDDDDDDIPAAPDGDAALARKLSRQQGNSGSATTGRKSSRLAKHQESAVDLQEGAALRERKQIELMKRRNEDRLQELARANSRNGGNNESDEPEEIETYRRTKDYPDNIQPNQVKVDMASQCVILPICGNPVPFHISTIKNVVLPDPDNATYLRINFYTAGMAVGKDAPLNTAKLVAKYAPYATFIREMTFRSLDGHSLTQAFRQISELRKRARTRELRIQEEANLVEQEKLVRTKNERVPRLSDLTMRPVFAGRKTQGNLEAHTNGLRFISTRSEVVDIMYNNIKYAIFQPCENEIMVLIHFHLKNPIMVGKKRHEDVQFFTEVVDASQTVDAGRRSMYDPDEMDDEQRERQLRKKLNSAFKEFSKKVEQVAKKNSYDLEFDIPYRDLGFTGNPHKEMVFIQPTLNCLVNLTETPFFVVDLSHVDHVHFERVTYMSKAFDIVIVNKDFTKPVWRIDMIDNSDKDAIQDWLTDMEITYTQGPMNLNWKQIVQTVAQDDRFYMDTEEDEVTKKEAGWEFLRLYGDDDDEEEESEEDSGYSEGAANEEEEEDLESEEEEEAFDSEDDEESDFDGDEELEEQGMDWEDMERQAMMDDKRRGRREDEEQVAAPTKKRRGSSSQRQSSSSQQRPSSSSRQQQQQQGKRRGSSSQVPRQQQKRRR